MAWIVRNVQTGEFISGGIHHGRYGDYMLTAFQSQAAKFATREGARIAVDIICNEYFSSPEYFEMTKQEKRDDH